jgi:putative flippase GtrA
MSHSKRFVVFNVVGALGVVVQLACVALLTNVMCVLGNNAPTRSGHRE